MNEFIYGKEEMDYLCQKDGKMKDVIETLGMIHREVDEDLFTSVIHHIVGQQISTKAQKTIYQRMKDGLGVIDEASDAYLQSFGLTFRKVSYMKDFALKVRNHEIDLDGLYEKSDEEVIEILQSLKGIGRWTAEMILLFCMQRKNVFAYDDLAIQRGLRMVYHHRKITKQLFEKYRRRFSPYCSIASLYLWAVAGGKMEGMKEYGK